jgi:hypothetical protein
MDLSCQARAAEDTVFLTSICQVLVAAHHCHVDPLHSYVHLLPVLHGHQQDADGSSGQPDVNLEQKEGDFRFKQMEVRSYAESLAAKTELEKVNSELMYVCKV